MSQLVRILAVPGALGLTTACADATDHAFTGGGAVVESTGGHPLGDAVEGGLRGGAAGAATTPRQDYY